MASGHTTDYILLVITGQNVFNTTKQYRNGGGFGVGIGWLGFLT